jgi:hypothetical protein
VPLAPALVPVLPRPTSSVSGMQAKNPHSTTRPPALRATTLPLRITNFATFRRLVAAAGAFRHE